MFLNAPLVEKQADDADDEDFERKAKTNRSGRCKHALKGAERISLAQWARENAFSSWVEGLHQSKSVSSKSSDP